MEIALAKPKHKWPGMMGQERLLEPPQTPWECLVATGSVQEILSRAGEVDPQGYLETGIRSAAAQLSVRDPIKAVEMLCFLGDEADRANALGPWQPSAGQRTDPTSYVSHFSAALANYWAWPWGEAALEMFDGLPRGRARDIALGMFIRVVAKRVNPDVALTWPDRIDDPQMRAIIAESARASISAAANRGSGSTSTQPRTE